MFYVLLQCAWSVDGVIRITKGPTRTTCRALMWYVFSASLVLKRTPRPEAPEGYSSYVVCRRWDVEVGMQKFVYNIRCGSWSMEVCL